METHNAISLREMEMDIFQPPSPLLQRPSALRAGIWLLFALAVAGLLPALAAAQASESSETEMKAANVFNFTKFVEWPDSAFDDPQAPVVFGIVGGGRLAFQLQRITAGQKVQGRNMVVRKQSFGDDLRGCHLLFISASEGQHAAQILAGLKDSSVLTVSDMDGFADAGGMVQIAIEAGRARFVVNLDAATQSRLRVSAKLLALARVINHSQASR